MCLEGDPGCPDEPDGEDGGVDEAAAIAQTQALLGRSEQELPGDVRVARRGDERFALTEDYRVGRATVELDDGGTGAYRVVGVTLELTDGPLTLPAD